MTGLVKGRKMPANEPQAPREVSVVTCIEDLCMALNSVEKKYCEIASTLGIEPPVTGGGCKDAQDVKAEIRMVQLESFTSRLNCLRDGLDRVLTEVNRL